MNRFDKGLFPLFYYIPLDKRRAVGYTKTAVSKQMIH